MLTPFNAELNPICHLLALLGAHHILHVSRIRVKTACILFFIESEDGVFYIYNIQIKGKFCLYGIIFFLIVINNYFCAALTHTFGWTLWCTVVGFCKFKPQFYFPMGLLTSANVVV